MLLCLIFGLVWTVVAAVALALPARLQWAMSWVLIATGIPLLGFVTVQAGPIPGLVGLVFAVLLLARSIKVTGLSPAANARKS